MTSSKPKAILYDNDGMIMHGVRFSTKYAKEFGIDVAVMDPFFDGPFKACLTGKANLREELSKVLNDWKWKGTVDELIDYWFGAGEELDKEVYDSVSALRKQGVIVCLATNQEEGRLAYFVKKFSYDKIFDEIFSSATLGVPKHGIEGLEKIANILEKKYGISNRADVMFWDDREGNVERFNSVGFNAKLYTNYEAFKNILKENKLSL